MNRSTIGRLERRASKTFLLDKDALGMWLNVRIFAVTSSNDPMGVFSAHMTLREAQRRVQQLAKATSSPANGWTYRPFQGWETDLGHRVTMRIQRVTLMQIPLFPALFLVAAFGIALVATLWQAWG